MGRHWPLILVCALVGIFATCYAAVTPYRQGGVLLGARNADGSPLRVPDIGAPDERQHANYIAHLLEGKGFPVLDPKDPNLGENYQSHQPPLYYILAAGWARLSGADPRDPDTGGRIRWLGVLFGIATVVGTAAAASIAFGRPSLGWTAGAWVGLLPMFLALNGAVSNDPLLFALSAWFLAIAALGIQRGWTLARAAMLGLVTGLALLTKTSALALFLAIPLATWPAVADTEGKKDLKPLLVAFGLALVLVLPWWLRNQNLYGDVLGLRAFNAAFVGSPKAEMFIQGLGAKAYWLDMVGWWTLRSFFGAFGYMDHFLPDVLYRVAAALVLAVAVAGIGFRRRDEATSEEAQRRFLLVGGFVILVVALQFLNFNAQYFQGQARYLFPALPPIAILLALGIDRLFGGRSWSWAVPAVLLTVLNLYVLLWLPGSFSRSQLRGNPPEAKLLNEMRVAVHPDL
ncbi:MAG TPA: DUF2142 domain-containing protein [Fimbriimonadaceae bacterium]|nr:DUF2142 domain-containing protein [Fimbriimonadaceae bacterium]